MMKNPVFRRILSAVTLILMLIAADRILTYLLEPISRADYFLHDMKEMKKNGQNVDMIIIGNSRSVFGFDPLIFEEELELDNVYNASVVGQQISSKYYITEAMIRDFEPKIVVFDVEWQSLNEFGTTRTQSKLLGLDRLSGIDKIRYILDAFDFSEWIYGLSKPYRFRDNLFREGIIANNLKLKKWLRDSKYNDNYYGTVKGYDTGSACATEPFKIYSLGTFEESIMSDESIDYMDRMVKLCKERGISLFFVSPPVSTMQILNIGRYQEANDFYADYAARNGVYYLNLNLIHDRDEVFDDAKFYHRVHLCEDGARTASHLLAEIIRDELAGVDTDSRFYASMEELTADIHRIVAVGANVTAENDAISISEMEYSAGTGAEAVFEVQTSLNGTDYTTAAEVVPPENAVTIPLNGETQRINVRIIARDIHNGSESYADYSVKPE